MFSPLLSDFFIKNVNFQALTAGQGQNPARQAAMKAGIPIESTAFGLNMLCGSGVKSVALGYQSIRNGDASVVVAGGQESMSKSPHVMHLRNGTKMGAASMQDTMLVDGLTDVFHDIHMGETAENLAKQFNITRLEQDTFAAKSQNLTEKARIAKYFDAELVSVEITGRKPVTVSEDEYPKHGTTVEGLSKLRACFIKDGTVTPGNASGLNDSAAAVLLMSEEEVKKRSLQPLAKVVGYAQAGCDPKIMGFGPVDAIKKLVRDHCFFFISSEITLVFLFLSQLTKISWNLDDVDLFELNEAFAAQALAVNKGLGVNPDKVNIHGGAIALGHPIGASGTRCLVTLLYALKRTGGKKGEQVNRYI
jgi:acetyl-CoA C-acetyltransferase